MCFIDQDNGRGDEVRIWATLDEDVVAKMIADALAQARLEGARVMQEAAAWLCDEEAQICSDTETGTFKRMVCEGRAFGIRTLDPQQVINESTGK